MIKRSMNIKPDNYWTDEMDQHIDYYQRTENNEYFEKHIKKPLMKMIQIISQVFRGKFTMYILADLQKEALTFAMTYVLKHYDIKRARSFSFFTVCLKRWFISENVKLTSENERFISIHKTVDGSDNTHDELEDVLLTYNPKSNDLNEFYAEFLKQFKLYTDTKLPQGVVKNMLFRVCDILSSDTMEYESTHNNNLYELVSKHTEGSLRTYNRGMSILRKKYDLARKQWNNHGKINLCKPITGV